MLTTLMAGVSALFLQAARAPAAEARTTVRVVTLATTRAPLGVPIEDSALLGHSVPPGGTLPTGTVTFHLYGPDDPGCAGPPVFTSVTPVNVVSSSARSGPYLPLPRRACRRQ